MLYNELKEKIKKCDYNDLENSIKIYLTKRKFDILKGHYNGVSFEDLAEIMNIKPSSVRQMFYILDRRLKNFCEYHTFYELDDIITDVRIRNVLFRNNIRTISDLEHTSLANLRKIRGISTKGINKIVLSMYNYSEELGDYFKNLYQINENTNNTYVIRKDKIDDLRQILESLGKNIEDFISIY